MLLYNAAVGALACLAALPWLWHDLAGAILVLSPLVCVPLGLGLIVDEAAGWTPRLRLLAVLAQPPTALCLLAAFLLPQGTTAAALAGPWLLFTFLLAVIGLRRVRDGGYRPLEELCISAALAFLAVGGGWTIASRAGLRPLDFKDVIVLLTGVHFHYAGFVLPLLTGLAGRRMQSVAARVAAVGVVAGVPLVALGITVGERLPWVQLTAAWTLAAACLLVALLQFGQALERQPFRRRLLLVVSAGLLVTGMILAATYALGEYLGAHWLAIETMIPWHGLMNSLGFALPGLAAWHLTTSRDSMQVLWRCFGQQPRLETLDALPFSPGVEQGPRPGDRGDSYERVVAQEATGEPEPDGPYRRLARAVRAYEIFPPQLVSGVLRRAPIEAGDTYGICYHFFPGVDLFFGGRATASFDGPANGVWRAGFTFRTLRGHPELGEETFYVEKDAATGAVRVGLLSWSRPGLWLTRLASPYARWVQVRACHAALDHLERTAKQAPAPATISVPTA
jgi:hypothetical protein